MRLATEGLQAYITRAGGPPACAFVATDAARNGSEIIHFMEYDEKGDPLEPEKAALRSRGVHTGSVLQDSDGNVLTIEHIERNGAVSLSDGANSKVVPYAEFTQSHALMVRSDPAFIDEVRMQESKEQVKMVMQGAVSCGAWRA